MKEGVPSRKSNGHLITLIRHPETIANVAHLLQGSTDSPLSVHGQSQQDALVKAIGQGRSRIVVETKEDRESDGRATPFTLSRRPDEIWTSPLPRALELARAIQAAFESDDSAPTPLQVRTGLEEKSFGARECTREGKHVRGFPVGVKPSEGPMEWSARVKREGRALLDTISSRGPVQCHIVVVTHGLWISAFLKSFLSNDIRLPFADNTGIFTLAISQGTTGLAPCLRVICANDTSHLAGLKRQRGGIGSSASDKRQRTLGDMWTKKLPR